MPQINWYLLYIIAVKAFPISNGRTSGEIRSWPLVSRMIFPFSGSFKATAMNVFVSAIIFMGTIVRLRIDLVKKIVPKTEVMHFVLHIRRAF